MSQLILLKKKLLLVPVAAGAVTLDAFTSAERTSGDGIPWTTINHAQGASANYALVMVMVESGAAPPVTVTYGGVSMSAGPTVSVSGQQSVLSFYLDSGSLPASGTKAVAVSLTNANPGAAGIWTLMGAATGAPNRNNTTSSASATSAAPSLASVPAGAAILSGTANNLTEAPTLSGGTQRFSESEGAAGQGYGAGDSFPVAVGTVTHTWTHSTAGRTAGLMLEILAA